MEGAGSTSVRWGEEFAALGDVAYLDHALRGPPPARALAALGESLQAAARGSPGRLEQVSRVELARTRVAELLGWPPDQVSFQGNTTAAVSTAARAIAWRTGDRVLIHADEVPANRLPWEALRPLGVEVEELPSRAGRLALEDLEAALAQGRVRVVSLAAVALGTGQRRPLGEIGRAVREYGALFCVDAAQALGSVSLDLAAVDLVCGCGRKWLLGPPEVGIFAVRPGLVEELEVPNGGAASRGPYGWRAGARRFEGGALPEPILAGLAASTSIHEELGMARIEAAVLGLAEEVAERAREAGLQLLSPAGAERSGVVQLGLPKADSNLEERLRAQGVIVRVLGDRLRVSPHCWNGSQDLERLFRALRSLGITRGSG